jgi:hypothetical protein
MSQFKPNSNIFIQTIQDDMAEMGLVTMSSNGMTDCYAEEMDYNVYILLSHGRMPFMDIVEAIRKFSGLIMTSNGLLGIVLSIA